MKISVFTPFYHTGIPYIGEAYDSLLSQTHTDWEWIILYNSEGAKLVTGGQRADTAQAVRTRPQPGVGDQRFAELAPVDKFIAAFFFRLRPLAERQAGIGRAPGRAASSCSQAVMKSSLASSRRRRAASSLRA